MEQTNIEKDITVMCVKASAFPQGIEAAHQALHSRIPFTTERRYFGISRPENGPIVYKAAAEVLSEGEPGQYGLETFVIPKGSYLCETLHNYQENISVIGSCFEKMLKEKNIDPNGFCLEWYVNDKDVRCLVKLA